MRVIRSIDSLQQNLRKVKSKNKKIGFVPTMGYLHEGHLSLIKKSKKENDLTVISIFVNPTQFGHHEDFKKYPRDKKHDESLAKKEKVDIIFYPSEKEMYPDCYLTYIDVERLGKCLCGLTRPKHFSGVATIVCKLLNIVSPNTLYLGQKDAQQAVIIKKMVNDLNIPVKVKVLPIIREKDGLAMSSRNKYLNPRQRKEAVILFKSLKEVRRIVSKRERNTKKVKNFIRSTIQQQASAKIDYIECVDAEMLKMVTKLKGRVLIALAVYFGKTRLIDNIILNIK